MPQYSVDGISGFYRSLNRSNKLGNVAILTDSKAIFIDLGGFQICRFVADGARRYMRGNDASFFGLFSSQGPLRTHSPTRAKICQFPIPRTSLVISKTAEVSNESFRTPSPNSFGSFRSAL